jgi:hypothetical protein
VRRAAEKRNRPKSKRRGAAPKKGLATSRFDAEAAGANAGRNSLGLESGDGFHLEKLFKTEFAPFAAVTRLLVAAKRCGTLIGHAV